MKPNPQKEKEVLFSIPPVLHGTACEGCGALPAADALMEVLGKDTVVVVPASCVATFSLSYSHSAWKVPLVHSLFESGPALATGIKRAYEFLGKRAHVVCFAGDAGTMDIGFQALSGAAGRNEDIIHICYDNEVAMNTGGQATSSSPHLALTPTTPGGMPFLKKDGPKIMAAHNIPYVATASVSHLEDWKSKLRKASEIKGFRYIHVLSPCPISWGYNYEQTREVACSAVETGLWMLYEVEQGRFRLTYRPASRRPVKDYFTAQERYRLLKTKEVASIQRQVDNAWRALS